MICIQYLYWRITHSKKTLDSKSSVNRSFIGYQSDVKSNVIWILRGAVSLTIIICTLLGTPLDILSIILTIVPLLTTYLVSEWMLRVGRYRRGSGGWRSRVFTFETVDGNGGILKRNTTKNIHCSRCCPPSWKCRVQKGKRNKNRQNKNKCPFIYLLLNKKATIKGNSHNNTCNHLSTNQFISSCGLQ